MKPLIKLAVTAALLAATSLTAWARPNGGGIIDRLDTDGDGLVTAEEADAAAFAKFDGNGDGYISREEARSVKKAMRKGYRERRKNRRSKSDSE